MNTKTVKNDLFSKVASKNVILLATVGLMGAALSGCGDDDNNNAAVSMTDYEVRVLNLTHAQPLSPLAVLVHDAGYHGWTIGEAASASLEVLAEGGDNSSFIASATGVQASGSGAGVVLPGNSESVTISVSGAAMYLTSATMLVNTNDAFAGVTGIDLSNLAIGDQQMLYLPVYDAGTEGNGEMAGTIPGPADGGEGFNAVRDDVNFVARHPGVVSHQDGYAESVLEAAHKFDAPVAMLTVTRLN